MTDFVLWTWSRSAGRRAEERTYIEHGPEGLAVIFFLKLGGIFGIAKLDERHATIWHRVPVRFEWARHHRGDQTRHLIMRIWEIESAAG